MTTPADNDFIAELRQTLESQPWYRRFANTVTSAVGALFLILWFIASMGWDIPSNVTRGVGSAIAVFTVLGVLKTKNGLTPRGVQDIQEYIGKHRK